MSFFATTTLVIALLSNAEAQKNNPCPNLTSDYFREINLSEEQRLLVDEMLQAKRAMRRALSPQVTGFRDKWMVDFLTGEMSRQQILRDIEEKYNQSEDERFEMRYKMVDLLASYDSRQIDQVLLNIENNKRCHDQNVTPPHVKKAQSKIRPIKFLLQNLHLTAEQQELLKNVRLLTVDYRQDSRDKFHLNKADLQDSMVRESIDRERVIAIYEERSNHVLQFKRQRAQQYMEFLDTLSEKQERQFIENARQLDKLLIEEGQKR